MDMLLGYHQKGWTVMSRSVLMALSLKKSPLTLLHGNMPVLCSDEDIQQNPKEAARRIVERIKSRNIPFHWFRNILKTPTWYVDLMVEI